MDTGFKKGYLYRCDTPLDINISEYLHSDTDGLDETPEHIFRVVHIEKEYFFLKKYEKHLRNPVGIVWTIGEHNQGEIDTTEMGPKCDYPEYNL